MVDRLSCTSGRCVCPTISSAACRPSISPTFTSAKRIARPIEALLCVPGPNALWPQFMASSFATGPFTITYAPGGSADITVDAFGSDEVILFAQGAFVGSPNLPAFTAVSYTNPGFTDASGTALSSDLLSGVPWQSSAWDDAYMYLILDDDDGTQATYVELAGTITSMTVVPEPTSFGLVAAGAIALALRARGRARSAA